MRKIAQICVLLRKSELYLIFKNVIKTNTENKHCQNISYQVLFSWDNLWLQNKFKLIWGLPNLRHFITIRKIQNNLQMKEYICLLKFDLMTSLELENLQNSFSNFSSIPIFFSNLNSNCSNLWAMRNLQEQVKKTFC